MQGWPDPTFSEQELIRCPSVDPVRLASEDNYEPYLKKNIFMRSLGSVWLNVSSWYASQNTYVRMSLMSYVNQ
ncbi:hypothetical protein NQ317_018706 [Molorchus minor]|uniref:Uncharacterized protein n=1 Tax=Molorchus minor TaxID=1323400 RepID=A0ABQ9JRS4_9CUCU|nr:hypothetical protein NQ317_018706 [Molorchus minor]